MSAGANIPVLVSSVASVILGGGGIAAILAYFKDRKKHSADGAVAAATVELQIDAKRLENAEQRLDFTQKAWDAERKSLEGRIERLEGELREERLEGERKDTKILDLQTTVSQIQTTLLDVSRELAELRRT